MLKKCEKMDKKELLTALKSKNIIPSDDQFLLLEKMMKNTIETNEKFNLTSITNEEEFREKMIYDSLLGLTCIQGQNLNIIDVGTGAGYPGLPLAVVNSENQYVLLDSTKKKIDYINKFVTENNINNVKTVNGRVEEYVDLNREYFDIAVARAVAPLRILIETIIPLLKVGGVFIAYKSKNVTNEIKEAKSAFNKLNCEIVSKNKEILPFSNEERYLIVIKKSKETNKKYPRDYSLIVSKPL